MSEEKEVKKEDKGGAKEVTLRSMMVSAIWIGLLSLTKAFWAFVSEKAFGLTMNEIVLSGIVMAAIFSPVYLSIVLDKIKDIKVG